MVKWKKLNSFEMETTYLKLLLATIDLSIVDILKVRLIIIVVKRLPIENSQE